MLQKYIAYCQFMLFNALTNVNEWNLIVKCNHMFQMLWKPNVNMKQISENGGPSDNGESLPKSPQQKQQWFFH